MPASGKGFSHGVRTLSDVDERDARREVTVLDRYLDATRCSNQRRARSWAESVNSLASIGPLFVWQVRRPRRRPPTPSSAAEPVHRRSDH
jgi:hypothetical protein